MTVTSPATALRARIKTIIDAEFTPEGVVCENDKLHESLGRDGTRVASYPDNEAEWDRDSLVQEANVVVQYFNAYEAKIDPNQAVDPAVIENLAERFKRACKANASYVGDSHDWYFTVTRIEYPDDPTGNKSRFVAYVSGYSANPAETTVSG